MGRIVTKAKAIQSLLSKGFRNDDPTHHKYYFYFHKGRQTSVKTYFSHGSNEDLGHRLLGDIKKQLKLDSPAEAFRFLNCEMDQDEFHRKLVAKRIIED